MSINLAVMDTRYGFTPEQVDVIKATIAPGATNEELALFLMVCQKKGLDPFSRQIYLSERKSFDSDTQQWIVKKSPETTIDGFRCIAERSGKYQGQLGPFWCGDDGEWKDVWLARDKMPTAAKIGILRSDFKEPVWGIALFEEYVQTKKDGTPNKMWQKMGANQLAKCAESLALRKAFPADLSGMYTGDEMAQSRKDEEDRDIDSSRHAQQYVAQRKIKELSAPKITTSVPANWGVSQSDNNTAPIPPETYVELANSLDQTPEPPLLVPDVKKPPKSSAYEMREAAKQQEAAEALKGDGVPKETRKRGAISFTALKQWGEIKKEILALTGTTDLYYEALKAGGYSHADEIKTPEDAAKIWKALKAIMAELSQTKKSKADEALLLEAQTHALRIGPYATQAVLKRKGLESVEEILNLGGDDLTDLLKELKSTA